MCAEMALRISCLRPGVPFGMKAVSCYYHTFSGHLIINQVLCLRFFCHTFWNSGRSTQSFSESEIMAFVVGKGMACLGWVRQLHKEVSHAASCQELTIFGGISKLRRLSFFPRIIITFNTSHRQSESNLAEKKFQPTSPCLMYLENPRLKG